MKCGEPIAKQAQEQTAPADEDEDELEPDEDSRVPSEDYVNWLRSLVEDAESRLRTFKATETGNAA